MPVTGGTKGLVSRRHARLLVAPGAHPIVGQLLAVVIQRKVNITHLARVAGVSKETIYRWAKGLSPRLHDLEAVAAVLGLRLLLDHDDA